MAYNSIKMTKFNYLQYYTRSNAAARTADQYSETPKALSFAPASSLFVDGHNNNNINNNNNSNNNNRHYHSFSSREENNKDINR